MMMCIPITAFDEGERILFEYFLRTVHEVVTVLHARQFNSLDAILDRPGTFCLNLMFSVFLTRELVSIL